MWWSPFVKVYFFLSIHNGGLNNYVMISQKSGTIYLIQIIFEWKIRMNQKTKSRSFFSVFLLIHEQFLSPWTTRDACLRFPSMIKFLQFLSHFQFLIEARNIFMYSNLNLLSSLCVCTLQFVFPSLLKLSYKYWLYLFQSNYYCYYCNYYCYI